MKGKPIEELVFGYMFPKPTPTDPQNFQTFLTKCLLTEVRQSTTAFYGTIDSREAQYPGLDYSRGSHRTRLSRFTWHRRLFRAFDALGLTKSEIAGLTQWEGTRWAKERFEKEHDFKIRDTTGDGISDWVRPKDRQPNSSTPSVRHQTQSIVFIEDSDQDEIGIMDDEEEDSDVGFESIGIELNERLRAAVAQRQAGHQNVVMDEAWEQWLKDIAEGMRSYMLGGSLSAPNRSTLGQSLPLSNIPFHLMNAGRLGQWDQVPEFLHNLGRENF